MWSLYLGGPTIQEVDGKMMLGLSIYGVAVISGSLYSRFYGMYKRFGKSVEFKKYLHGICDAGSRLLFKFRLGTHGQN